MRTKWKNKGWLALLLAVVLCTGFTSCKDDDDEDGGNLSSSIIGSWEYRDVEGTDYGIETYTFYADGKFELIYEGGSYSSGSQYTWNEGGTYTLSGSTLTLTCTYSSDGYISEPESYTVSINGERLTMTDEYGDPYVYYKTGGGNDNGSSDNGGNEDGGNGNEDGGTSNITGKWRGRTSKNHLSANHCTSGNRIGTIIGSKIGNTVCGNDRCFTQCTDYCNTSDFSDQCCGSIGNHFHVFLQSFFEQRGIVLVAKDYRIYQFFGFGATHYQNTAARTVCNNRIKKNVYWHEPVF